MPGSLAEFALEHEFDDHHYLKNSWMRDIVTSIVRVSLPSFALASLTSLTQPAAQIVHQNFHFRSEMPQASQQQQQQQQHEFAERFKYVVISSSLLASSLPQQLQFVPARSRTPSSTSNWTPPHDPSAPHVDIPHNSQSRSRQPLPPALFLVSLFLVLLSVSTGHYITALVIIAASVQYALTLFHSQPHKSKSAQTILTLDTLNTLVDADAAWNAAVSEAMSIIDRTGCVSSNHPS